MHSTVATFILWLEWQGFYADEALEQPQVVVRDRLVLDVNELARRAGILPGMSVQEAKNIVPKVVRKLWRDEDYVARQRIWLDHCLPFCSKIEALDNHLAALDLSGHPRPLEIAEQLTEALVRAIGLPLKAGAGPSKWTAALAAQARDLHPMTEDPGSFLSPMPIERLLAIEPATRERLAFLGYRKVGDVALLPPKILQDQFGKEGWRILQAAKGTLTEAVAPNYPPNVAVAALSFDGPPDTLQAIDAGFARLAAELETSLAQRGAIGKKVELSLWHEDGQTTCLTRTFARPLATDRDLLNAMRLMLTEPPEAPVERISVALPDLRKARRVQLDIHDRRSRDEAQASLRAAMTNVRTVFGDTAVRQGAEIATPRWQQVRRAYREAFGWSSWC